MNNRRTIITNLRKPRAEVHAQPNRKPSGIRALRKKIEQEEPAKFPPRKPLKDLHLEEIPIRRLRPFAYIAVLNIALILSVLIRGDFRPYDGLLGFLVMLFLLVIQARCFRSLHDRSLRFGWFTFIVYVMTVLILLAQFISIEEVYPPFYAVCIFMAHRMAIAEVKPKPEHKHGHGQHAAHGSHEPHA